MATTQEVVQKLQDDIANGSLSAEDTVKLAAAINALSSNQTFEQALIAVAEGHLNASVAVAEGQLNTSTNALIDAASSVASNAASIGDIALLKQHYELLNGDFATVQYLLGDNFTQEGFSSWLETNQAGFIATMKSPEVAYKIADNASVMIAIAASTAAMATIAASAISMSAIAASATAMSAIAASATAMSTIAASATAMLAIVVDARAMTEIAISATAVSAIMVSDTAMSAIATSATAMTAIAASDMAMTAIVASDTVMPKIIASITAMTAIAASTTAMKVIAASTTAITEISASDIALTAINNSVNARNQLYAVATKWLKAGSAWQSATPISSKNVLIIRVTQKDNPAGWGVNSGTGQWIKSNGTAWTTSNAGSSASLVNYNGALPFVADDTVRVFSNSTITTYFYNTFEIAYILI